jgi:hypothetical protein
MAKKVYQREELTDGEGVERWVRLPTKPGERLHGLSRSAIYILIDNGVVKSATVKQPGKLTGVRLLWLPSLLNYIESCTDGAVVQ